MIRSGYEYPGAWGLIGAECPGPANGMLTGAASTTGTNMENGAET